MSDIKFKCPSCGTELEAPPEMAGDTVECPSCSQAITIPAAEPAGSAPVSLGKNPNACPNCLVNMAADTILCVHCGFHKGLGKVIQTDLT